MHRCAASGSQRTAKRHLIAVLSKDEQEWYNPKQQEPRCNYDSEILMQALSDAQVSTARLILTTELDSNPMLSDALMIVTTTPSVGWQA